MTVEVIDKRFDGRADPHGTALGSANSRALLTVARLA
jgi:hypothetical protein